MTKNDDRLIFVRLRVRCHLCFLKVIRIKERAEYDKTKNGKYASTSVLDFHSSPGLKHMAYWVAYLFSDINNAGANINQETNLGLKVSWPNKTSKTEQHAPIKQHHGCEACNLSPNYEDKVPPFAYWASLNWSFYQYKLHHSEQLSGFLFLTIFIAQAN